MDLLHTIGPLEPEQLFPAWCWIDDLQTCGAIGPEDALAWKGYIFGLMEVWNLEPGDALPPVLDVCDPALRAADPNTT